MIKSINLWPVRSEGTSGLKLWWCRYRWVRGVSETLLAQMWMGAFLHVHLCARIDWWMVHWF